MTNVGTIVDVRSSTPSTITHGAAVYVTLDTDPVSPVLRFTRAADAAAVVSAMLDVHATLQEMERAVAKRNREAVTNG